MDENKDPLTAAYTESVDREKSAWQELHSHPPGTPERISAWKAWSEAISRTNDAWRRLSARRFATSGRDPRSAETSGHAHA